VHRHVRLQSCAPGVCRSASRTPPPLTSPIAHNLPTLPSPPLGLRSFIPSTGFLGRTAPLIVPIGFFGATASADGVKMR
jgi:hypothetical protein